MPRPNLSYHSVLFIHLQASSCHCRSTACYRVRLQALTALLSVYTDHCVGKNGTSLKSRV
ncbi:uncharacterized protein K452DRAFT_40678 [Aplosporella prunicola CBS 121167]|uniref:Uncharacterized protein n=1 Tax=Aplosporella prunicola CBS 121167 TaxID=1176127 RepID=A0A6A6BD62_9PEZI|nr:uncharacterized protein K452DRAFT_40678 [Aplosporella prunicola CBS 121167]KAF2141528.1 hypothetical protein K452DRAFT_40678 [Aplosporella prunicola CBS 121167]